MSFSDVIELKDFDTVLVNGHATAPFCVSWSEDDKIALLVEDGVQIFELYPTPLSDQLTVTFLRSWIPASTDLPFQNVIVDNKANSFVWKLKRKEVYEMAVDSTLTSIIEKSVVSSFVIQCSFSPLICNESYLSCLTNNGVLQIYQWNLRKWRPIINVTDLWIKYCDIRDNIEVVDFNLFKLKIFQLKITAMTWVEKPKLLFVTGHEDGGICIWKVDVVDRGFTLNVCHYFHVIGKPCYIGVCEVKETYLIVVGTILGTVKYIPFKATAETEFTILGNEGELWKEEDSMKPSFVKSYKIAEDTYIFTVKNHILLIQKLEMSGDGCVNVTKTDWREFSAPVVSLNEYQNDFIVTTRNHEFFTLKVKETGCEVMSNIDVPFKPKHQACFHCYGLTMSKNKAIWIVVSSAKVNYDAKTMKDTVHLLIFLPKMKYFKSLSDTTCTGLINKIAEGYSSVRLTDISDLLELKKCEILADASNSSENASVQGSTPLELKLAIWESRLRIFIQSAEMQNIVSQCEYMLALQWCTSRRNKYLENQTELTDKQKHSLEIMDVFLKETKSCNASNNLCIICGEPVKMDNIRLSSCTNSHFFPRCSLSLLPCDSVPYAFCRICDSTVLLEFISDNDYRCLFCDGLLIPDTRVLPCR
ncbi:UNVERIFIED_CONTAM: hypothetical protein PYX00_010631 [Menopon gallinae]|uniref:Transcription factor IIIC 90kDa subunit N-terminal domain-containing protein n=1 Tax=Menopon gallinae TaxID=328185 RepID=A0AAW2HH33_9NEOP